MVFATESHFRHAARSILDSRRATQGGGAAGGGGGRTKDFTSLFGVSPEVCALTWNLFDLDGAPNLMFKHLLWALMFMKVYAKLSVLVLVYNI